ncbi:MAG: outer membrane protein assembly factor BamB, partial [Candidatus Accumulibacter sp.]|nr:outer membrane protein assembly factor BamB [Accumulibacter sp.]
MRAPVIAASLAAAVFLGACSTVGNVYDAVADTVSDTVSYLNPFSSKPKMTELKPFTPTVQARVAWNESVGRGNAGYEFQPAVFGGSVYAAAADGSLVRLDEGKAVWRINAGMALSGGVGTDGRLVVVGSPKGDVLAFNASDGTSAWKAKASSEILAPPAIGEGLVVVRSGDNRLTAFGAADGRRKWVFQRPAPALALRVTAPPLIDGSYVFAGFPGGRLLAVRADNGVAVWEGAVALPKGTTELERVADVTSSPVIAGRIVCAVAFQGRVACFDLNNGNLLWARELSSSVGLAMDSRSLFVTDDQGAVHALDLFNGSSIWKQDGLLQRRTSAPLPARGLVAVSDAEGYVHFLNRDDGAFAARIATDGSPAPAAPRPLGNGL